ncbi:MAG: glycosyltransferase family 2 protein [Myxococcales bacterium]|nr:glycosyltransferase family 2 protein [Myxococcales bacterium]
MPSAIPDRIDLSIVVFAFNEQENVGPVLRELVDWLRSNEHLSEIVFVDDGSSDQTTTHAEAALDGFPHTLVRHDVNRGIGAALKSGVAAASGSWVTFMPADGQIAPDAIGTLRAAADRDQADVVLSVYDHRDDGLHRKVLSWGVRSLILAIHGVRLHSDGPYLFRRTLFDPNQLKPDTFFLNFEFPIRVMAAGLRIGHVTIACRPRRAGLSKSASLHQVIGVAKDLVDLRVRRTRDAIGRLRGQ